jgi:hypothetical protein
MMKLAFVMAAAVAVLTTAPVTTPAKAQGIDVQIGRDRYDRYDDRYDRDRRRNDLQSASAQVASPSAHDNAVAR